MQEELNVRFYIFEAPIVTAVTLCSLCLLSTSVTDHAHVHIYMCNRTNSLSSNKTITIVPWKAGLTQWLYVNQQCPSTHKISTKITTALASIFETLICSNFVRLCMHKEDCFSYTKFTQQRALLRQNCTFKRMLTTNRVHCRCVAARKFFCNININMSAKVYLFGAN
jgi:hypothetical protein